MEDSKAYNEELFEDARGQLRELKIIRNNMAPDADDDIVNQVDDAIDEAQTNVDNLAKTIGDIERHIPYDDFTYDEDYFNASFSTSGDSSFASLNEEFDDAGLDGAVDIIDSGVTAGEAAGEDE